MLYQFARLVSTLGHPFFTMPLFAVVTLFRYENAQKATWISLLMVGGILLPLGLKTYVGFKKGKYTNMDVSNRDQRKKWYWWANILMLSMSVILFAAHQGFDICLSFLLAWLLMAVSQGINQYLKTSLHVAFHTYLSFLVLSINVSAGIVALCFAPIMGWSRVTLGRHTIPEVVSGGLLGMLAGGVYYFRAYFFDFLM
jgi:hypothetical protein